MAKLTATIKDYTVTKWANGTSPALNADNLNKIEEAIVNNVNNCESVHKDVESVNNDLNTTKEKLTAVDETVTNLTLQTFLDKDGEFTIDAGELKDN